MKDNNQNVLGIRGISETNLSAGIGFIIIPENIDIDLYKEDVFRTGRVSIYGGYGHSNFHNVLVDRDVIQRINFPNKVGEFGTPVVWINIPKHNEPIIIACLKYDDVFHSISENRSRITRIKDEKTVDLDLNANNSKVILNVKSDEDTKGEIEIILNSINHDGIYKILIDGKILEKSTDSTIRFSEKEIVHGIIDKNGKLLSKLELKYDEQNNEFFVYDDVNKNKIIINKNKINIRADESSKIDFGEGSEKAVLGDTLKKLMEEYDDAFSRMTIPTAFGPSGTRLNELEFKAVRDKFEQFLSKLVNLD